MQIYWVERLLKESAYQWRNDCIYLKWYRSHIKYLGKTSHFLNCKWKAKIWLKVTFFLFLALALFFKSCLVRFCFVFHRYVKPFVGNYSQILSIICVHSCMSSHFLCSHLLWYLCKSFHNTYTFVLIIHYTLALSTLHAIVLWIIWCFSTVFSYENFKSKYIFFFSFQIYITLESLLSYVIKL